MSKEKFGDNKTEPRGLRLSKGLWRALDKQAKSRGEKTNQYIAMVLENHILRKKIRE